MANLYDIRAGAALRSWRRGAGLSQEGVGDAIGKTFQQIQKYENGKNRIAISTLVEMQKQCGLDAQALLATVLEDLEAAPPKPEERLMVRAIRKMMMKDYKVTAAELAHA